MIAKRLDGTGRIHIPKAYRKILGVREDDILCMFIEGKKIIVFKPDKEQLQDKICPLCKGNCLCQS